MLGEASVSRPRPTAIQRADRIIRAMYLRQFFRIGMKIDFLPTDGSLLLRFDRFSRRQRALIWFSPREERVEALALLDQAVLDARQRRDRMVAEYLERGNRAAKEQIMGLVQRRRANRTSL